jgi:hypothetical protein
LVIEIGGARLERFLPGRLGRVLFVYLVLNRTRDLPAAELMGSPMAYRCARIATIARVVLTATAIGKHPRL